MCGRYTLSLSVEEIWDELDLEGEPGDDVWSEGPQRDLTPRFNIAPSQAVPVVTDKSPSRLVMLRWGLVPFWAKDPKIGYKLLNARAETLADKPAFRDSFERRRCIVLADGFYEWKRPAVVDGAPAVKQRKKPPKTPFYMQAEGGGLMTFAGVWASWKAPDDAPDDSQRIISCTIVTREATGPIADIHHRMPVILGADARSRWLDRDSDRAELSALLEAPPPELALYEVRPLVNSVKNDGPELIEPAGASLERPTRILD